MKADPAAQRRLLDLAAVDAELSRADHRRRTLPEQAAVEDAERHVRERRDAVVIADTTVGDMTRDVTRLDREVEQVRTRETRDQALLDAGSVSAKQATDLSHEMTTLARRRSVLEDEQLELMERQEAAQEHLVREKALLDEAETTLGDAVERRDGVLEDIGLVETRRAADRTATVADLPGDLLDLYESIRRRSGVGAGELTGGRCGSCRIEMDRSELGRVQGAAADEVVRCDQCGAIVVRA